MYTRSKSFFHIWALFTLLVSLLGSAVTATPAHAGATIVVNTNAEADVLFSDGKCSLREAIYNANYDSNSVYPNCAAGSGTDTITFDANYTITLSFGQLIITSPIIINGNGTANTIIQADASPNTATWRLFEVSPSGNLTLNSVMVKNGRCDGSCPTATNQGGGIYVNGGGLTVTNSAISGNRTSGTGGGGGIYNNGGTVAVTNSTLSQNSSLFGGGIQSGSGSLSVTNSTFSGNFAYKGGGIGGGNFSVTNSTLSGNGADTGGGIYHSTGTLTVTNSMLTDNDATSDGGGIANSGGTLILTNSNLSGNTAGEYGGGIFNQPHTTLVVTNSTLSGNSAHYGGGIYGNGSDLSVTNSTLYTNSATYYGGGIYGAIYYDDSGSSMPVANSTFYANSASKGGGIYVLGVALTVTNSTLSGNSATTGGGGIYNEGVGTLNYANTIIANSALSGDCAINTGTIATNTNNLVGDGSCSAALSGDPKLGILGDNGGSAPTMALLPNSPAINAGDDATCAAAPVNNLDQRGVPRPIGAHCDIGSFEAEVFISLSLSTDSIDFSVQPVGSASAPQTVTVTNDGTADLILGAFGASGDFALTNDNCSGQAVAAAGYCTFAVSFHPASAGAKNGTISIPSNAASSPDTVTLSGTGVLSTTTSFKSIGSYDGHILESSEDSNVGGSASAIGATLIIGDNAYKKQYRVILHFNTVNLPDNAVVTSLMLKVKKQGGTGANPFTVLGDLQVDIASPYFGSGVSLLASDFQAAADASNVGSFNPTLQSGNWLSASLNSSAFPHINLTGTTQFRLGFSLDDNNDAIANTLKFFSGNYSVASYRPVLIVTYYLP